ncbi:hypothetical protein [Terricaulis sp.]|uniref:hypothetical protein n=1 Tax=Terricaulis sp. TaxID=2768686 RepID=UPI003783A7F6
MISRFLAPVLAWMLLAGCASALDVRPATVAEGAAVLSREDEVTAEWTPADISIRLRGGASSAALRQQYAAGVSAWSAPERARLTAMLARNDVHLTTLARWLPEHVLLVKNSDAVEGGLPHTRGNAIMFGPSLPRDEAELDFLFWHELFHVLSRHNAARHDEMYGLIGFVPCTTLTLPDGVSEHTLTNPDAPVVRWVAPAPSIAADAYVTPLLLVEPAQYDPAHPSFTDYFDLRFLRMTRDAAGACAPFSTGADTFVAPQAAMPALFAVAGANTDYVLHPEETLADNFAQMMVGKRDVANPEVQTRLASWLGITPPARQGGRAR